MIRARVWVCSILLICCALPTLAQPAASAANSVVPMWVNFGGVLTDINGKPLTGMVGVSFYLYQDQQGGAPLWIETQNVQPDRNGHYSVMLGSTTSQGLPADLFVSGEARWLGVQAQGQPEQPRVMLLSVPYALKAVDAETVGGLPPSAFVLAAPPNGSPVAESSGSAPAAGVNPNVGGSGTTDFVPLWTDSTGDLGNSALFQSGTSPTAKIGINITTPASTLDVKGNATLRGPVSILGTLALPATGPATSTGGKNSQPLSQSASVFNSGTKTAVTQTFQWQAEPAGNNTSGASGSLNLLFGEGTAKPSETGLNIASNGQITFAAGQTFPGTGSGTITGVNAGSDLLGGGTSGNVTLNLDTTKVPQLATANTFTANQTVNGTVTATSFSGNGSALTNLQGANVQGAVATANNALDLGGLPASAYQPAGSYATSGSNNFTGNQSITGNLSATGSIAGGTGNFTGLVTEAGALLPASGTATATQGFNSQPLDSVSSVYNSSTAGAQSQDFRWLAEPVGNDSSSPSGKLDLLFGANGKTPTETGLSLASNGQITFAAGQTFPGTGSGTVTSVGSGAGLTGGPITGSGSLSIATGGVSNSMLANSLVTVTANSPLSGGGAVSLGGSTSLGLTTCAANQVLEFVSGAWACTNPATGTVTSVGSGPGLTGGPITGSGTLAIDPSVVPLLGAVNTFTAPQVVSENVSGSDFAAIWGANSSTADQAIGVWGLSTSTDAVGIYGEANSFSSEGFNLFASTGVWGDTGVSGGWGVLATTDDGTSVIAYNNSAFTTAYFENDGASGSQVLVAGGYGSCSIYSDGNLSCTGSKSAVVPVDGGSRKVALYAVEAPENWFEDFGSGQLSNGSATINLEPTFAQTVNTDMGYHVFLTPKGDCEGLYLANQTSQGFEVRELRSGRSNIAFDYRIVARRRGYEGIRLADMTERSKPNVAKGVYQGPSPSGRRRDRAMLPPQPVNIGSRLNRSPAGLAGNK